MFIHYFFDFPSSGLADETVQYFRFFCHNLKNRRLNFPSYLFNERQRYVHKVSNDETELLLINSHDDSL